MSLTLNRIIKILSPIKIESIFLTIFLFLASPEVPAEKTSGDSLNESRCHKMRIEV
jgi:hypothetical protein